MAMLGLVEAEFEAGAGTVGIEVDSVTDGLREEELARRVGAREGGKLDFLGREDMEEEEDMSWEREG
jgi:hypothetical protein